MRRDVVLGVHAYASDGERQGELVHGTGYHDRTGHWKNGSRWVRRYPDAKVRNGMSRHALRARDSFHALRDLPNAAHVEADDVRAQAVLVVIHTLNWLNA